jgi:hypothetical protein
MPDEQGESQADAEKLPETSQHAYKDGREDQIEGSIPEGDQDPENATNTGGATSGGPPREAGQQPDPDPSEVEHEGEDQDEPSAQEADVETDDVPD